MSNFCRCGKAEGLLGGTCATCRKKISIGSHVFRDKLDTRIPDLSPLIPKTETRKESLEVENIQSLLKKACALFEIRNAAEVNLAKWSRLFCRDPKEHSEGRTNATRLLGLVNREEGFKKACALCKHWGVEGDAHLDGMKRCHREYRKDSLFIVDGGDGSDSLYTHPTFSCIQFEPNEV